MSTEAALIARLRIDLQEPTANQWTDATLRQCVNDAHKEIAPIMGDLAGSGWFEASETITVAASTETYTLSGLTYEFAALHGVFHTLSSGVNVRMSKYDDDRFESLRTVSTQATDLTPGYLLRRTAGVEYLHILPLSSGTRTFRLSYRYIPPTLAGGDSLHTPARYDPLIAALAKRLALAIVGETDDLLEETINRLTYQMMDAEGASASETTPSRIHDESSAEMFGI